MGQLGDEGEGAPGRQVKAERCGRAVRGCQDRVCHITVTSAVLDRAWHLHVGVNCVVQCIALPSSFNPPSLFPSPTSLKGPTQCHLPLKAFQDSSKLALSSPVPLLCVTGCENSQAEGFSPLSLSSLLECEAGPGWCNSVGQALSVH